MALSLPISGGEAERAGSAAVSAVASPTSARRGLSAELPHAPSIGLPLRFVGLGLVCLLAVVAGLMWRPDVLATYHYNQYVIALTHLMALGWISSIVMGATYQLVPVALETRLHSERMARWHFGLHLVGVVGMVSMFWVWNMKQVGHFGTFFAGGVVLFVYNIGRTLARVRRWDVVAGAIAAALFWLVLAVLAGLFLAATKCWPLNFFSPIAQMHAHAHAGVLGFFVLMTLGIGNKLVPMFTLSDLQNRRRAWAAIGLVNLGLAGAFPSVLLASRWKPVFAGVVALGVGLYLVEIRAIVRARKRRKLDWALRYFFTALCLLGPVTLLGWVLAWPNLPMTVFTGQLENVYGLVTLLGVLSLAILGMLFKIVPFLVWQKRYSPIIGRAKVPTLADLYSAQLQAWCYWLFIAGLTVTSVATTLGHEPGVRAGCGLLAAGLLVFAGNIGRVLSHLGRLREEPVPMLKAAMEKGSDRSVD